MMKKVIVFCMFSTALSTSAWGQTAPVRGTDEGAETGEIIVTAQKRSERLSDVPLSITAATGEQLANVGVSSPSDLVKVVPGFTYRPSDYGTPVFYIRGVGFNDIAVAVAPAVSVYVDQVALPYSAMTQGAAFDLERVEVLKGPQGTLFGQNSTGGAMNFIAAKPTKDLEASVDFTYGRYNQIDLQGFVSGPISDTVRGRLAVRHEGRDGWQISQSRPDDRLGKRDFTTARLTLDFEATDALKLEFSANGWKDRSETLASQFVALAVQSTYLDTPNQIAADPLYANPAPNKPRIADWGADRPAVLPSYIGQSKIKDYSKDDSFFQFALRGDLELSDDITLTAITAYSQLKLDAPIDPDGTRYDDFGITLKGSIKSFSQELRIAGKSGPLQWMIGGNYAHDTAKDDQWGDYYGSNTGVGPQRFSTFINSNHQKVRTAAVFGSVDYEIVPSVTARASARYTDHKDRFEGCLRDAGDGELAASFGLASTTPIAPGECVTLDQTTFAAVPIVRNTLKQNNSSWRAGLDWKPTRDALVYANVTRGFKAGSYPTVPGLFPEQFSPVTQERVTAYEAGFKLSALDRKVQLTGAGFHYQYKDKQIIGYIDTVFGKVPALVQIPRSKITGFEVALTARPISGLTLNGGVTYVHSKITSSFLTPDGFGVVVDVKGEQFPVTPKWQLNGDIDYRVSVGSSMDLVLGTNVRYQTSAPATFGHSAVFDIPGYALVDLRGGLEAPDGQWKVQLWGRNIFNKFYLNSITHVTDTIARTAGMGATYGVTTSFRF
ncbi:MAG: TonB-dependent receptor [Sphingobium sp.]|nr:TonB-dependent receptor [Sphingobium sp.]MBP9157937.1 TonB-dependent receptor [Sphingobium sp.]